MAEYSITVTDGDVAVTGPNGTVVAFPVPAGDVPSVATQAVVAAVIDSRARSDGNVTVVPDVMLQVPVRKAAAVLAGVAVTCREPRRPGRSKQVTLLADDESWVIYEHDLHHRHGHGIGEMWEAFDTMFPDAGLVTIRTPVSVWERVGGWSDTTVPVQFEPMSPHASDLAVRNAADILAGQFPAVGDDMPFVFTDGSVAGHGGAFAYTTIDGDVRAGRYPGTDSTTVELAAIVAALRAERGPLAVVSDSECCIRALNTIRTSSTGKKFRRRAHQKLLEEASKLTRGRPVRFLWVRGHSGHPGNELVDKAAKALANRPPRRRKRRARPPAVGVAAAV